MSEEFPKFPKTHTVRVESSLGGVIWLLGWLFTIGYLKLIWWEAILGIIIWPYYIGAALR